MNLDKGRSTSKLLVSVAVTGVLLAGLLSPTWVQAHGTQHVVSDNR